MKWFSLGIGSSQTKFLQGRKWLPKAGWAGQVVMRCAGEHITDIYITETGTTELENLSHNIFDIFIIET